jgi:hypothetical protein
MAACYLMAILTGQVLNDPLSRAARQREEAKEMGRRPKPTPHNWNPSDYPIRFGPLDPGISSLPRHLMLGCTPGQRPL